MPQFTPSAQPGPLLATFFTVLAAYRRDVRQERLFVRLAHLTCGAVLALGRHTLSQLLVVLGIGDGDWSAWYRLFNRRRIDVLTLQQRLVAQVVAVLPAADPAIVVGVDGTQVPRSSKRMPGCGLTVSARSPKWQRGLHYAQRYVGISALLPRSAEGDSRAVPLRWSLLRTAKTTAMGDEPERTECQGALTLATWLRERVDEAGRAEQPLLVLGDGAYSNAGVLRGLPERTLLFARCAKNRALYALPTYRATGRGRQRRYGERGPTPLETLHTEDGWRVSTFMVRGRQVRVTAKVTGPWVVKLAPFDPVLLIVVKGVDHGNGVTRRQRDPQFFLTSLQMTSEDEWAPALPIGELLAWAWQRWELEVMHRELKSSFGLGEQQAFSADGAATVIPWMVWVYALLVLTAYRTWGYRPASGPPLGRWWRARRWSIGGVLQAMRQELWQLGDFQPVWQRSPDTWAERTGWIGTFTNATLGVRRL